MKGAAFFLFEERAIKPCSSQTMLLWHKWVLQNSSVMKNFNFFLEYLNV